MKNSLVAACTLLAFRLSNSLAGEFEPAGKALVAILGTTKVMNKKAMVGKKQADAFYVKDGGKVTRLAFIEHGVYEPDCTHTWAIGVDPNSAKVTEVRVIEMKCPHAYPTRDESFLKQYKGIGPAELKKLNLKVAAIAKATGSSTLTSQAVTHAVESAQALRGKL